MSYLGYDLLQVPSNVPNDPSSDWSRSTAMFDPGIGARSIFDRDTQPSIEREFEWICARRQEIVAAREWVLARKGRLVPFWIPTLRRDLELHFNIMHADEQISIERCGYSEHLYPSNNGRRHLAFYPSWANPVYRKVTSAEDNGSIEVLGLSSSLGAICETSKLVSFLILARLASDDVTIQYITDSIAKIVFRYVELPLEAP